MAAEPIHVEVDEDVPAIVDRLRHSRSDEIHLLLPARARFGESRFNFQLLKQYSMRLGKRVAIVSSDPGVQRLAEESGFGSFRLPEASIAARGTAPSARQPGFPQSQSRLPTASTAGPRAAPPGPGGPAPNGGRFAGVGQLGRQLPLAVPGARIRI